MTMIEPRPLLVLLLLGAIASVSHASADSVYLKNGRIIHTAHARIEHQRVVFILYGAEQSIPLALVERIADDDHVGPAPMGKIPRRPASRTSPSPVGGSSPSLIDRAAPSPRGIRLPPALAGGSVRQTMGDAPAGVASGVAELLRAFGTEIEGLEQVVPVLPRLFAAFQQSADSPDRARALLEALLGALADLGVSRADIMARAREYGVPGEWIEGF